ncbi:MAG: TonB-dependent receptor, partial [Gammaproteobacteria bacterium]|nr:TonB-dependent receptor [Gammaproteobacteria bacterium]
PRTAMTNLVPNETVNETNLTLTINNPSLLPQTATNWDATLEYYFEPVGNLSVGWFHKEIKDYLVSGQILGSVPAGANNGFSGEYAGFTMLTTLNAGTAFVQGWEISYQQQFTFLPGLLKGLAISANYTSLLTHGDFGGTAYRSTHEVTGFVPRTGNFSLSWRHRAFSARVLYNYTSDHILAFTAATQGRNQYRRKREMVNLGCLYQLSPRLSLTADVSNLFNEPIVQYRGIKDQMERTLLHGTTLNLGVSGRF